MRVKVYSHPLFPKQAYVAGLYLSFDGLLPEHYNHFSVLKILIPWQKMWKSELLLLANMYQAGKKKHNMSQGDELFQLGVVIQECQFFLCACMCQLWENSRRQKLFPALRLHTSIVWPVKLQPLGGFERSAKKPATGRWSHPSSLSWTII